MYKRQPSKGQSSTNHDVPANQFAPRRFVIQPQTEEVEQTPADLQAKSQTTPINHPANIPIFPPGYQPPPPPRVQMKLSIGEPGDKYEQEADELAKDVVQRINSSETPPIQPQPQPEEEIRKKSFIQRLSNIDEKSATPDLEASIQRMQGSGQPLAETIKTPMEQAFGADFSSVKIHTDAQSDQMNQSIQAKAFTTGQDIFFRQGTYDPGSRGGQELIAHELTHVVQQTGSGKVQKSEDREIVSIVRAEKQIQRIEDDAANEALKKYGRKQIGIKQALERMAKLKGYNDYNEYRNQVTLEQFKADCEIADKTEGSLTDKAKQDMTNDIVVPQSYYHVTKSFDKINGLVTTGAATCTGLAMSASNADGETIYALTHIDGDNDIKGVIDGMINDMTTQIGNVVGNINAYIASGGVKATGGYRDTPKDVVEYLNKQNVTIHFTSQLQQIRIGGSSQENDLVRVGQDVDKLHGKFGSKNVDGLIQQVNALPQMKGGHGKWEELKEDGGYSSGKHDPMEATIETVLGRALQLQDQVKDQPEKFQALKKAINDNENWYKKYLYGKKILAWAGNENQ
ncbi:DUF4157 domain-containing protein [Nostoc spongiaeforme FACHB-130]|uniref:DUF4157 domain-containing protein n=1 Tax=Nostoc spongiaeforme FACHB-130 TaxID=1357510 RepID=A0ABR8FRL5_9NOSO|nr:DUF4157 domain-containing protein [Nostoc spongiaeforme]MBD2593897.1 DUF4157 domain-containing protein [Nostoc spongiaeforme FACHB-130]